MQSIMYDHSQFQIYLFKCLLLSKEFGGTSLVVSWLRLHAPKAGNMGSILEGHWDSTCHRALFKKKKKKRLCRLKNGPKAFHPYACHPEQNLFSQPLAYFGQWHTDRFDSVLVLTLGFKKSAAFLLALQSLCHNHENRSLSSPLGPQEGWERCIIK